jgi:hypothetical protein
LGVEAAERYLEGQASPCEVDDWVYMAEGDLCVIATFNSVCDEKELPDEYFRLQSGRVQLWVDEVARIPPNKLRKLVRTPRGSEELLPRKVLEEATNFAFLAICWTPSQTRPSRIESYTQFLCPHVLRETIRNPFAVSDRR